MDEKTPIKRQKSRLNGAKDGKPFTTENQPTPEQKSKGWQERRAERLLTQQILAMILRGQTLEQYARSLLDNAMAGNAKAIETINKGIEDQVDKHEVKVEQTGDVKVTFE